MTDKTRRFYGSAPLGEQSKASIAASFQSALDDLEHKADFDKREVLWGTLTTGVSRQEISVQRLTEVHPRTVAGPAFIGVDAECVRAS